jgi:ComF family protein
MLAHLDPRHWLASCVRCGLGSGVLCEGCTKLPFHLGRTPGGLEVKSIAPYAGHLGECLRRLKYHDETHLAFPLGRALRALAENSALASQKLLLLPVPLHPARLAERGYNQSALIGRQLASGPGARLVTGCLFRHTMRTAQAQLSGAERRTNMLGVFRALPAKAPRSESALSEIFLLDDVVTTGSTVDACAAALASVGIQVRAVLACAIAGEGRDSWQPP